MVALLVVSFLIAGCGSGGGESAAVGAGGSIPDFTEYYNMKMMQFALNPPKEGQFQYEGDSNTEGVFAISATSANPRVRALSEVCFNGGISGDTTTGLLNRMWFHLAYRPEVNASNMGTNDIQFGQAHMVVLNYRKILALAKDAGVKKYHIISIIPRPEKFVGANETTDGINEELRLLAEENSDWVEYIDINTQLKQKNHELGEDKLFKDSWHLTKEGFELMAELLGVKLGLIPQIPEPI